MVSMHSASSSGFLDRTLPCHTGYAMGVIVPVRDLELPFLLGVIQGLGAQLQESRAAKEGLGGAKEKQAQINTLVCQIKQTEKKIGEIQQRVKEISAQEEVPMPFGLSLPIDYDASILKTQPLGNNSEVLDYIILNQKKDASDRLKRFGQYLTQGQYDPTAVRIVKQISSKVLGMLGGEQNVFVLGSFITLRDVRIIDPVKIREDGEIEKVVKEKAGQYAVITKAILGGMFIGCGYTMTTEKKPGVSVQDVASSLSSFSYVARGAIPKASENSIWATYVDWKEKLVTDQDAGFPIAFSVRHLPDILRENGR